MTLHGTVGPGTGQPGRPGGPSGNPRAQWDSEPCDPAMAAKFKFCDSDTVPSLRPCLTESGPGPGSVSPPGLNPTAFGLGM